MILEPASMLVFAKFSGPFKAPQQLGWHCACLRRYHIHTACRQSRTAPCTEFIEFLHHLDLGVEPTRDIIAMRGLSLLWETDNNNNNASNKYSHSLAAIINKCSISLHPLWLATVIKLCESVCKAYLLRFLLLVSIFPKQTHDTCIKRPSCSRLNTAASPQLLWVTTSPASAVFLNVVSLQHLGELLCSYGVMGGYMQPQGHVQVLLNMLEFGMEPQEALDKSRFMLWPAG